MRLRRPQCARLTTHPCASRPTHHNSIAYKRAVLNCIDYLSKVCGYTKEQVRASALCFSSFKAADRATA